MREIISSSHRAATKKGIGESINRGVDSVKEAPKSQATRQGIVEDLCREGVIITVSYKGDRVITAGSKANSNLTHTWLQ